MAPGHGTFLRHAVWRHGQAVLCNRHGPGIARKRQKDGANVFLDRRNLGASLLEIFLQLERISLNREIQIADGESADDVADRAAGKVKIHTRSAGNILHEADALQLVRRQPDFHRVNVISHSLLSGQPGRVHGADEPDFPQDFHRPQPHSLASLSHGNASG